MNTVKEETTRLDDKIDELVALTDQIGAVALCTTDMVEELQKVTVENALNGIVTLCELMSSKLIALLPLVEGVTI